MRSYNVILDRAAQLPGLVTAAVIQQPEAEPVTLNGLGVRALTRVFVEGHVRRRAGDLRRRYIRLSQQLSSPADDDYINWLQERAAALELLQDTLTSWPNLFRRLWPILTGAPVAAVVGYGLAKLGAKTVPEAVLKIHAHTWLLILGLLFFPVLYTGLLVDTSFSIKRLLMLTADLPWAEDGKKLSFTPSEHVPLRGVPGLYKVSEPLPSGDGVFGREAALAAAAAFRRKLERPTDALAEAATAALFATPFIALVVWTVSLDGYSTQDKLLLSLVFGVLALACLGWGAVRLRDGYRRRPR